MNESKLTEEQKITKDFQDELKKLVDKYNRDLMPTLQIVEGGFIKYQWVPVKKDPDKI